MLVSLLEGLAGLALALLTLRDVFDTVIVPRHTRGPLKVSRRLVQLVLPLHKHVRRRGIAVDFAPAVLVGSFVAWILLLLLAFGLMVHALADRFDPVVESFPAALYIAGAAMSTMGFGTTEPSGLGAVLTVAASFCGLAVVTMAITYLIEVQSNIATRDRGVLEMTNIAGRPPTALVLLERYGELRSRDEIPGLLREARQWCNSVLQSHVAHPTLIYFRSAGTSSGWPAALGAMCDLALVCELLLDEKGFHAPAVLARESGARLALDLSSLLALDVEATPPLPEEVEQLLDRLDAAGYRLRPDRDVDEFIARRAIDLAAVQALARHLGTADPLLLPASK